MRRKSTRRPAPLLPLMPRPSFGGTVLAPGFEARRPFSGQPDLFGAAEADKDHHTVTLRVTEGGLSSN